MATLVRRLARGAACAITAGATLLVPAGAHAGPGDLDPTFGDGGRAVVPAPPRGDDYQADALAVAPARGGKVVVAGVTQNGWTGLETRTLVTRYRADGSLDHRFGVDGQVQLHLGGGTFASTTVRSIAALPDGTTLVSGQHEVDATAEEQDWFTLRLDRRGRVDESYGRDGLVVHTISRHRALDVATSASGRSAHCSVERVSGFDLAVVRMHRADGRPARAFGVDGVASHRLTTAGQATLQSCALVRGRVVLTALEHGQQLRVVMVRLDPHGALDATFGVDGYVRPEAPDGVVLSDALVLPDLALRLLGHGGEFQDWRPAIHALRPDGTVDIGYGDRGTSVVDELETSLGAPRGIDTGLDGQLLLTSTSAQGRLVYRLDRDGDLDRTFGDDGVLVNFPGRGCTPPHLDRRERPLLVCGDPVDPRGSIVARLLR